MSLCQKKGTITVPWRNAVFLGTPSQKKEKWKKSKKKRREKSWTVTARTRPSAAATGSSHNWRGIQSRAWARRLPIGLGGLSGLTGWERKSKKKINPNSIFLLFCFFYFLFFFLFFSPFFFSVEQNNTHNAQPEKKRKLKKEIRKKSNEKKRVEKKKRKEERESPREKIKEAQKCSPCVSQGYRARGNRRRSMR